MKPKSSRYEARLIAKYAWYIESWGKGRKGGRSHYDYVYQKITPMRQSDCPVRGGYYTGTREGQDFTLYTMTPFDGRFDSSSGGGGGRF